MELCALPQTGASDAIWPIVIALAAILIVTGGVLMRSGAARRRVLTGIGALAIVGALALGTVAVAPAAQADAGTDCVTAPASSTPAASAPAATTPVPSQPDEQAPGASELPPRPEPTIPEIVTVTPEAPTAAAQCGTAPAIAIPTQEGVTYTEAQEGTILTVTATPQPGYVLAIGAPSTWTFDLTPTESTPFPFELPEQQLVFPVGSEEPTDDAYMQAFTDPELMSQLAAAEQPGVLDIAYEVRATEVPIRFGIYGAEAPEFVIVPVPFSATLDYDATRDQYVLAETTPGAFQLAVEAARADLQEQNPESSVEQAFEGFPDFGLAVVVSYVPGPGCDTETYEMRLVFPPLV